MTSGQVGRALLVALLWGIQFVTTKVGLASLPPLLFLTLRFLGVATLLLPFVGRPVGREWRALAAISVFYGSLCFGFFFAGLAVSGAGIAAVVAQLMTPFSILFAWPMLRERPRTVVLVGVTLAFTGVGVALGDRSGSASLLGAALVATGAASQGLGNVLVRRLQSMPPFRLVGWMSLLAAPQLAIGSVLFEHGQVAAIRAAPILAWGSLAYATLFGAVMAFALWFGLLRELPLARVAPFALLQTVFAIAAGVAILDEKLTVPLIGGALLCIAGVALTQINLERFHRRIGGSI